MQSWVQRTQTGPQEHCPLAISLTVLSLGQQLVRASLEKNGLMGPETVGHGPAHDLNQVDTSAGSFP